MPRLPGLRLHVRAWHVFAVGVIAAGCLLGAWQDGALLLPSRLTTACPRALRSLGPASSATEAELNRLARRFYEHCKATPELAEDKRVRALDLRWNKHVLLSDFKEDGSNVMGSFNKMSGCLLLRELPDRPRAEQLGIMLHELAHSSGWEHDEVWRDAFLFFCNVATQRLGWEVALKCPTVCRSYNVCSRQNCEQCDWIDWERCHA